MLGPDTAVGIPDGGLSAHADRGGLAVGYAGHVTFALGAGVPQPTEQPPPVGQSLSQVTDPFALGVHRAIDAGVATGGFASLLPVSAVLPIYIPREHDVRLRETVQLAIDGRCVMIVLVGGPSTGKTRACWEAIENPVLQSEWRLWHPIDPGRPEAIMNGLQRVTGRTLIWLDELQHYLRTPTSDLGERVAAGLRELLRDPRRAPVLVVGTVWPEYWADLTAAPKPGQADSYPQSRALLADIGVPVPEAFNGVALNAAWKAGADDPRLALAFEQAEAGQVTQYLAGVPELIQRYHNAPPAAKAVIEAAMDALRLGHSTALPQTLLEAAAPGYLTDQQWDELPDDWLEQAFAYAAAPCLGARGVLTRIRPRPSSPQFAQPCYRLADYLAKLGETERSALVVPACLWDAFTAHANHGDLALLGSQAYRRGLYRHAFQLYTSAGGAGSTDALREAAEMLREIGRINEAPVDYQRLASENAFPQVTKESLEAGKALNDLMLAEGFALPDFSTEAVEPKGPLSHGLTRAEALQNAVDADVERSANEAAARMSSLYAARNMMGPNGALAYYIREAESGHVDALVLAARQLEEAGRLDEALTYYQRAASAGYSTAVIAMADLLQKSGRAEESASLRRYGLEADGWIAEPWTIAEVDLFRSGRSPSSHLPLS